MELLTDRLRLRPFRRNDFASVHSYASDLSNVKYTLFGPNTAKETKRFIAQTIESNAFTPRRNYDFVIEKLDSSRVIGACSICLRAESEAEIGYILHRDFWNNNYTTEAAKALIEFGFTELKLHRIIARCNSENIGSYRVMEKCGMQREACFRQSRKLRSEPEGRWYDDYQYSILDVEFNIMRGKDQ